jgi:hypothetical protein
MDGQNRRAPSAATREQQISKGTRKMADSEAAARPTDKVLAFDKVVARTSPFPHFISPRFYAEEFSNALLSWLESTLAWNLKETALYAQYELGFSKVKDCPEIQAVSDGAVLARIRDEVSRAFGVAISGRINISAHKLVPGQYGGIHTDNLPSETHRLVVQLNRGRSDQSGGNLVFLSGSSPREVEIVFKQQTNSAVGFLLGTGSYHAVTQVKTGVRFTIIYTFLSALASDAEYSYFVAD